MQKLRTETTTFGIGDECELEQPWERWQWCVGTTVGGHVEAKGRGRVLCCTDRLGRSEVSERRDEQLMLAPGQGASWIGNAYERARNLNVQPCSQVTPRPGVAVIKKANVRR